MSQYRGVGRGSVHCRIDGLQDDDWQHMTVAHALASDKAIADNNLPVKTLNFGGIEFTALDLPVEIIKDKKQLVVRVQLTVPETYMFPFIVEFDDGDWQMTHNNERFIVVNQFDSRPETTEYP